MLPVDDVKQMLRNYRSIQDFPSFSSEHKMDERGKKWGRKGKEGRSLEMRMRRSHGKNDEHRGKNREVQRPTEGRSTGPNRDRRSQKMDRIGLGPNSVRSALI